VPEAVLQKAGNERGEKVDIDSIISDRGSTKKGLKKIWRSKAVAEGRAANGFRD
jgi:hypothetical protein